MQLYYTIFELQEPDRCTKSTFVLVLLCCFPVWFRAQRRLSLSEPAPLLLAALAWTINTADKKACKAVNNVDWLTKVTHKCSSRSFLLKPAASSREQLGLYCANRPLAFGKTRYSVVEGARRRSQR